MTTNFSRGKGKLYDVAGKKLLAAVSYQVYEEFSDDGTLAKWGGEVVFTDSIRPNERDSYILELEDSRRGMCFLRKRVNKAVVSVPPRFYYLLSGTGKLQ